MDLDIRYQELSYNIDHAPKENNIDIDPVINKPFSRSIKPPVSSKASKKTAKKASYSSICRLLSYPFHEYPLLILGILLLTLSQLATIYLPLLTGQIIDSLINSKDTSTLHQFLITFIISGSSLFFRNLCFTVISERVTIRLKNQAFSKFISYDIEFFDVKKTGELLSRMNSDIAAIRSAISSDISVFLKSLVLALGSFVIMFTINVYLTLIIMAVIPLFVIITSLFSYYTKKFSSKYQDLMAEGSVIAEECFSNIRTVKAFATEQQETSQFESVMNEAYKLGIRRIAVAAAYRSATHFIINTGVLGVLWYGGYCVLNGEMTSGQLVTFLIYANDYTDTTSSISSAISSIVSAAGLSEGLFKLMDYKPKLVYPKETINEIPLIINNDYSNNDKSMKPNNILYKNNKPFLKVEFQDVNFSYPTTQDVNVLTGFTLSISPGEVIGICGVSGSGKSTIVSLLERFYDSNAGEILINSHSIKEYSPKSLANSIGFVSQEPVLFSGTIEENILYGVETYRHSQLIEVCQMSNVWEFIEDKSMFPLGLKTMVGERGSKLSGGQKQRVAIARALMKRPRVLIFDEATSALDSEAEMKVQQAIDRLMGQGELTIIVIAHRLSSIAKCQRVVVIEGGKIVEEGKHWELWEKGGVYRGLVERQIKMGVCKEEEILEKNSKF